MNKIDTHIHCCSNRQVLEGTSRWGQNYIADPLEMRTHLKNQGIEKAILMSCGESGGIFPNSTNMSCQSIASDDPAFFSWMCNFDVGKPETVYDRMAEYKAHGAVGVGELMVNEWMDSPFLSSVFHAAELLGLPVTIHMSPCQRQ